MIFESLYESAQKGELLLIDGGYCRWHRRKDGTITIYEILSMRPGAGSEMLVQLKAYDLPIQVKCPADLPSNAWYVKKDFRLVAKETTKSGRVLHVWRFDPW